MASTIGQHDSQAGAAQSTRLRTRAVGELRLAFPEPQGNPLWLAHETTSTEPFDVQMRAIVVAMKDVIGGLEGREMVFLLGLVACLFSGSLGEKPIPAEILESFTPPFTAVN